MYLNFKGASQDLHHFFFCIDKLWPAGLSFGQVNAGENDYNISRPDPQTTEISFFFFLN